MHLGLLLISCSPKVPPGCDVTPRLDQVSGWLLGPTSWRVSTAEGRIALPPEATPGAWTLAFPGFAPAPVTLDGPDASPTRCLPETIRLVAPQRTVPGRVWGLAGGARAEVVGCGGLALTTTSGHFDLPVSELPCEVRVVVDDEVQLIHVPVTSERPLNLSLRLPSLGLGLRGEGPPVVVSSHRGDDEILPDDVILSVDGVPTPDAAAILAIIRRGTPGTRVDLVVQRQGQTVDLRVPLVVTWEDDSGVHFDPLLR